MLNRKLADEARQLSRWKSLSEPLNTEECSYQQVTAVQDPISANSCRHGCAVMMNDEFNEGSLPSSNHMRFRD